MGHLKAKARNAIADRNFAIIKHQGGKTVKKYPIEDLAHAKDALSRASAQGPAVAKKVDAKVYAKYPGLAARHRERAGK